MAVFQTKWCAGVSMAAHATAMDITPGERMLSSTAGAVLTSLMMTPFDVVKTRLQKQAMQTPQQVKSIPCPRCYLYCNGLMDHIQFEADGTARTVSTVQNPAHITSSSTNMSKSIESTISRVSAAQARLAGASSTTAATLEIPTYMYPSQHHPSTAPSASATSAVNGPRLHGTMDAFRTIWRTEGLPSLWRGLPPTLVMAAPATVIYFTSYDYLRDAISSSKIFSSTTASTPPTSTSPPTVWWAPLLAGSTARVFAVTAISPLEMIRTKLQAQTSTQGASGVLKVVQTSIQTEGIGTLWRGLGATLLRDVPFSALYWFGYETIKTRCAASKKSLSQQPDMALSFAAGAIAGSFAAAVTLPFDVVKTRVQVELGTSMCRMTPLPPVPSTWSLMSNIFRSQGLSGLFVGLIPRVAKVAPSCAIMITSYEYCKEYFRLKRLAED